MPLVEALSVLHDIRWGTNSSAVSSFEAYAAECQRASINCTVPFEGVRLRPTALYSDTDTEHLARTGKPPLEGIRGMATYLYHPLLEACPIRRRCPSRLELLHKPQGKGPLPEGAI